MTLEEAGKVAAICSSADGRCVNCAAVLCVQLREEFPEFSWSMRNQYDGDSEIVVEEPGKPRTTHTFEYTVGI